MGTCCDRTLQIEVQNNVEYLKSNTLSIQTKSYLGKIIGFSKFTFENTSPIKQQCSKCSIGKKNASIFGCILPGVDPKGEVDKECQDNYVFLNKNQSVLCALYDGHGKEGKKIADFCVNFTEKHFFKHFEDFEENPQEALIEMLHKCDMKLKKVK